MSDPATSLAVTLRYISKRDESNLGVTKQYIYLSKRFCWYGTEGSGISAVGLSGDYKSSGFHQSSRTANSAVSVSLSRQ